LSFGVSDFEFRVSGFRFRGSDFWVSGSGFRGFDFRVSGFGSGYSGFGFREGYHEIEAKPLEAARLVFHQILHGMHRVKRHLVVSGCLIKT